MKRAYQTCDLMHGNICVSEPCICKGMHMSEMRKKRGGKRENSGRKKKEETVVIRVPKRLKEQIEKLKKSKR